LAEVVPELARYNIEFNANPQPLAGDGLARIIQHLGQSWRACDLAARQLGTSVVSIGLLPTLRDPMLTQRRMTKSGRFRALNEQVLRVRQGRPISLAINGRQSVASQHRDVMLESATTSFQLHLQVPLSKSVRTYNSALIVSAPIVALAANSPYLFGQDLWDETRITLFEQALDLGPDISPRVTFGSHYARQSLEELFIENIKLHPVLLPTLISDDTQKLGHLRLHNGTIWRWNRPLLGFDDDGSPHLRIEHRVMAAGPTLVDMAANMAFYYGLVEDLSRQSTPPESLLPFGKARDNFYRAAQLGLRADVAWLNQSSVPLSELIINELLPRAAEGLAYLGTESSWVAQHLEIIRQRVISGQTGAAWQRSYVTEHGPDFTGLVQLYRQHQQSGQPVHVWNVRPAPGSLSPTPSVPESMLCVTDSLPTGLLTTSPGELRALLGRPTLIHLPGRKPDRLFVSVMLHGNEPVGLLALQQLLGRYRIRELPRALSVFIGNVWAAEANVRHLPTQPDYNRVWPDSKIDECPEHALMRHVVREMTSYKLFASIDLHNNTGWNPHYSCVRQLDYRHLQLATLFGRTAVYFRYPVGVQTGAFSDLCPSVTCECGKTGDPVGIQRATEFLEACLHIAVLPDHPVPAGDLDLYHTIATLRVADRVDILFDEFVGARQETGQVVLRSDLDHLNFRELEPGELLGCIPVGEALPLIVQNQQGDDCTPDFIQVDQGTITLKRPAVPAMLTCNTEVIRQDCLGYFMERLPLDS
jgi:gamma-glutamyl:cysteine ligase YbdK (ATP-grasp superfamily)